MRAAVRADVRWTLSAYLAGVLTCVGVTGGLVLFAQSLQPALIVGAVVGMLSPSVRRASLTAAAAILTGLLLGPRSVWTGLTPPPPVELPLAAGLAALAGAAAVAVSSRPKGRVVLCWGALGVIALNLWATASFVDSASLRDLRTGSSAPSLYRQLEGQVPEPTKVSDEYFFVRVRQAQAEGLGYYDAYARAMAEHVGEGRLTSPVQVRMPALFLLWRALPSTGEALVKAFLFLALAAVLAVPGLTSGTVRLPFAVPGAAAVASYLLFFATQMSVLYAEPWAGALGLVAASLWCSSYRWRRWRLGTALAVAVATLAVLVRELMLFLPLAALASAFVTEEPQRRYRAVACSVPLVSFAAVYAFHVLAVTPHVAPGGWASRYLLSGGARNLWAGLTYGSPSFGDQPLVLACLALLGLAGAFVLRPGPVRLFAAVSTLTPLALFLLAGNRGFDAADASGLNYWGAIAGPLLLGFSPAALGWLIAAPGTASRGAGKGRRR